MPGRHVVQDEGNARASVLVQRERWTSDDGYRLDAPFESAARVTEVYAQFDASLPRARRGLARELLCSILRTLVRDKLLRPCDVLALESDHSDDDQLVRKVYVPMGFAEAGRECADEGVVLLRSTVGEVLRWCG